MRLPPAIVHEKQEEPMTKPKTIAPGTEVVHRLTGAKYIVTGHDFFRGVKCAYLGDQTVTDAKHRVVGTEPTVMFHYHTAALLSPLDPDQRALPFDSTESVSVERGFTEYLRDVKAKEAGA